MPLHKFITRHSKQNWFFNAASLFYVSISVESNQVWTEVLYCAIKFEV